MTLIGLILTLVVIGLIMWLISLLPIVEPYKRIINVIVIVVVVIWLLSVLLGYVPALNTPIRIR
jgi:hypothetical protein